MYSKQGDNITNTQETIGNDRELKDFTRNRNPNPK